MKQMISRRDFLIKQIKGTLFLLAGTAGISLPRSVVAGNPMNAKVKIPHIGVAKGNPGPATRAAVGLLGGMKSFVKPGDKVVIKPNLSFPHSPESATNTHPLVTREIVSMCKEAGASRIRVLDNPTQRAERCIKTTKDALSIFNQDIVHALVDQDFYKPVSISEGKYFKHTDAMQDVLEADVLIAAPVAKSHTMTGVSLSMKGMMGLIYNRQTMHADYDLDQAIIDLCSLLKPDLVVVDLIRVLSTNGPWGPGRVIRMNSVIASNDMVAADAKTVEMCEWYGQRFEPRQVDHIRIAHERGLGRMDVENLHVKHIEA